MTHLPTSSVPTRLDASQGARFPPNASFDSASVHPTMHQIPGPSCPPSTSLPILTLPEPPSFSATLYGAGGTSPMPNYQDQDTISLAANFTTNSTFVARPLLSQDMHGASGSSSVSNYYGQDNIPPPANLIPNSTFVARPLLSQDMHGASGSSSLPNYHGQGNVYPPANLNPTSTLVAHPSLTQYMCGASDTSNYQVPNGPIFPPTNVILPMSTQESCQPFTDMLPSDANAAFLQSEGNGSHDHTARLTSQWALPMEAPVTAAGQQTMYQVPQSVVRVEPPKEPGSAHKQIDVTSDGASSARQMSSRREQWKNLPGFRLRVKNRMSKTRRTSTNENDREQYYCDLCENWVLVHRKKYHNKKHNAGEFVCKICEILGEPCEPLSRKDALKRHVHVKHPMLSKLLHSCSLRLLVPRRKNEREDLEPLIQAMIDISES